MALYNIWYDQGQKGQHQHPNAAHNAGPVLQVPVHLTDFSTAAGFSMQYS